jgi:hypothetical protein
VLQQWKRKTTADPSTPLRFAQDDSFVALQLFGAGSPVWCIRNSLHIYAKLWCSHLAENAGFLRLRSEQAFDSLRSLRMTAFV